jgi:hypothetical protein
MIKIPWPTCVPDVVAATTTSEASTRTDPTAHQQPAAGAEPMQEPPAGLDEVRRVFVTTLYFTYSP